MLTVVARIARSNLSYRWVADGQVALCQARPFETNLNLVYSSAENYAKDKYIRPISVQKKSQKKIR